ncbi:hypothetical protein K438DRAFT_1822588 [Mycena galopus ATCC 62051]|nr:hypothetical protein K438DRAFT_1822588 [Mycena galopus ATCC 62051]
MYLCFGFCFGLLYFLVNLLKSYCLLLLVLLTFHLYSCLSFTLLYTLTCLLSPRAPLLYLSPPGHPLLTSTSTSTCTPLRLNDVLPRCYLSIRALATYLPTYLPTHI